MKRIDFEKGIVNHGDWSRLSACMKRAANGESLTLGFLGGSITQGSLASTPETCYAYRVYQWWTEKFPKAKIQYINAGIGGTTSQFGVARVEEDLLRFRPDVIFIEFSVNDDNNPHFRETYEGLVRRAYGPALVLIHNVRYDDMTSAEEMHLQIGRHYDLPCVSMKSTIYPEVAAGRIANREITPDDLHPNDLGHAMVAGVVTHLLDRIYEKALAGEWEPPKNACLPAPLTANQYQCSIRYQNHNSSPILEGFTPDPEPQHHITQTFRRGYTAEKVGDKITFFVEGTGIAVQYRKSVTKPTPIAKVVVDDREEEAMLLDGNFQEDWGDCLYLETVLRHGENRCHKVEIRIVESHENDMVPFYLVSVIGSK